MTIKIVLSSPLRTLPQSLCDSSLSEGAFDEGIAVLVVLTVCFMGGSLPCYTPTLSRSVAEQVAVTSLAFHNSHNTVADRIEGALGNGDSNSKLFLKGEGKSSETGATACEHNAVIVNVRQIGRAHV